MKMAEFLGHFYKLTERLSKNLHVNAHNFMFEICEVNYLITNWMNSKDLLRKEMGKRMKEKFDKYWGNWHDQPAAQVIHVNEGRGRERKRRRRI